MTPIIDERANRQGQPGLHVFIVGISAYPHLPRRTEPTTPASFGMRQLSSTALTAYKVFRWVEAQRGDYPVPLTTCRLLLSPCQEELAMEPHMEGLADPATLDHFMTSAHEWREDASAHQGNVTLFYFAGHGVQRRKNDAIILLQGFGDGRGAALRHGVEVQDLFYGMAPSPSRPNIARKQLYFIDACRNTPSQFRDLQELKAAAFWDIERSGRDDRAAPIYYAALEGSKAYALRGEQTVFGKALLHCLDRAVEDPEEDEEGNLIWPTTVYSLNKMLDDYFDSLDPIDKADQDFCPEGIAKDFAIYVSTQPPMVDVEIQVRPPEALGVAKLEIRNARDQLERDLPLPLPSHPFKVELQAGTYGVKATIIPPTPPFVEYSRYRPVKPPRVDWKVRVV